MNVTGILNYSITSTFANHQEIKKYHILLRNFNESNNLLWQISNHVRNIGNQASFFF